ncbi:lasso peptide biosynthesis B2 protein [Nitrospira sp. Kam-Ns4a]
MERLRKACQLTLRDWLILGEAWVLFLVIAFGLRLFCFRSLLHFCHRLSQLRLRDAAASSLLPIARCAWLTAVAGRYAPIQATCLTQALVLSVLLGRRGVAVQLRIGVSRQAGRFAAHAWLEREGSILPGLPGGEGFEPLLPHRSETSVP